MNPEELLDHADFIQALARRLVKDEHRAADLFQETWLAILKHGPQNRGGSIRAWLSRVVLNGALLMRRKDKLRSRLEQQASPPEGTKTPEEIVAAAEGWHRLMEQVLRLEEPYRSTILLRFSKGLSAREIAGLLNIPVATVRTRITRGLDRLKLGLDARHGGDRRAWVLALAPFAGWKAAEAAGACGAGGAAGAAAGAGGASSSIPLISGALALKAKIQIAAAVAVVVMAAGAGYVLYKAIPPEEKKPQELVALAAEADSLEAESRGAERASTASDSSLKKDDTPEDGSAVVPLGVLFVLLGGRVVSGDGAPVSGVCIDTALVGSKGEGRDPWMVPPDAAWEDTGVRTGEDGRFQLPAAADLLPLTRLRFRHPDHRDTMRTAVQALPQYDGSFAIGDVTLLYAFFIRGHVRDKEGKPAAGCTVAAPGAPWGEHLDDKQQAGADGAFRLRLSSQGEAVRVFACDEGSACGWSEPVMPGSPGSEPEVSIVLSEGAPISGKLLNADGSPATGRKLFAAGMIDGCRIDRPTFAEEGGRFEFPALPLGVYRIEADPIGFRDNLGEYGERPLLAEQVRTGERGLDLRLPEAGSLKLRLLDEQGTAVDVEPKIYIQQIVHHRKDPNSTHHGYSWTGMIEHPEPGVFIYGGIQPGQYSITVRVPGLAAFLADDFTLSEPPTTSELEVRLLPVKGISGNVYFADGSPAAGITVHSGQPVRAESSAAFNATGIRTRAAASDYFIAVTDAQGSFRFEGLNEGDYSLVFTVNGMDVFEKSPITVTDENPRVEVPVQLPNLSGVIQGVVFDAEYKPLAGACVVAWNGGELFQLTWSDGEGRYRFKGLPDGRYILDARKLAKALPGSNGFLRRAPTRDRLEDPEVQAAFNAEVRGGSTCCLDLSIPDSWDSTLRGRVNPHGRRLPEGLCISLRLFQPNAEKPTYVKPSMKDLFYYQVEDDRDGRTEYFNFGSLRGDRYVLCAEWVAGPGSGSIVSEPFTIEPSTNQVKDLLLPLTSISGRVIDRVTGGPAVGASLHLKRQDTGCPTLRTSEDGSFEGKDLPEGEYMLVVQHAGHAPYIRPEFKLQENQDLSGLFIELEPGCDVEGFIDIAKEDWSFYRWWVLPEIPQSGLYWEAGGRVEKSGRFRLEGLPRGKVKLLLIDSEGGNKIQAEFEVELPLPEGERLTLNIP